MRENVLYSGWDVRDALYLKEFLPFQENFIAIMVVVGYHGPSLHNLAGYSLVSEECVYLISAYLCWKYVQMCAHCTQHPYTEFLEVDLVGRALNDGV